MDRASVRRAVERDAPFATGLVLGALTVAGMGTLQRRAELLHVSDFAGIWAGGRAALIGADPYDAGRWLATTSLMATQPPDTAVYGYTPWVALTMVPLATLPLGSAAAVWTIGGIALAIAGVATLMRVRPVPPYARAMFGFALIASQPALTALMVGQWSFIQVGALALASASALRGRRVATAVPLVVALAKPQLWLFAVPALIARVPRAAMLLAPLAAAIVAAGWLTFPGWWEAWTRHVAGVRASDPPRAATLPSLVVEMIGPAGVPVAIGIAVAIVVVIAARFGLRTEQALPLWLSTSLLVAPYAWSYDWLLLVVPFVLAVSSLSSVRPRAALALTLVGGVLLVLVAPALYALAVLRGRETLGALIPLAATLSIGALTWSLAGPRRSFPPTATTSAPGRGDRRTPAA